MDFETIISTLKAVVIHLEGGDLPSSDIESAWGLLDAGEPGIALENLCAQLFGYDVSVPPPIAEQIKAAGEAMRLEPSNWADLAVSS